MIAVTLGQARRGVLLSAQRAVRLLAIPKEDLDGLVIGNNRELLQNLARASFKDLDDFARFDACTVLALKGEPLRPGLPRACEPDGQ